MIDFENVFKIDIHFKNSNWSDGLQPESFEIDLIKVVCKCYTKLKTNNFSISLPYDESLEDKLKEHDMIDQIVLWDDSNYGYIETSCAVFWYVESNTIHIKSKGF